MIDGIEANEAWRVPADHVDHGRASTAERHVQKIDSGHELEQLAAQMHERADAGGGILQLARLLLGQSDELLHRLGRQVGVDHRHDRGGGENRDRRESLDRVVGQRVHPRIDRDRDRDDEQRVAVLRRARHQLARDRAACPGLVFDDELLAQPLAQLRRDQTGDDVVDTARRERNEDPYRLGGVVLRRDRRRQHQHDARGPQQQCAEPRHGPSPGFLMAN